MPGGPKQMRKQDSLIAALLTQPTILQAAKVAGVSEATATRWLKEPAFQVAYREARRTALDRSLAFLEQSLFASVLVLRNIMLAADTPATTKVAAARTILEFAMKAYEVRDQEERLAALEADRGARA
jgi:hypothetical protein